MQSQPCKIHTEENTAKEDASISAQFSLDGRKLSFSYLNCSLFSNVFHNVLVIILSIFKMMFTSLKVKKGKGGIKHKSH